MHNRTQTNLARLFCSGVAAVKGDLAVRAWLVENVLAQPTHIFAAGKAATSMFLGLPRSWTALTQSLIVTKTNHLGNAKFGPSVEAIEASHPVPSTDSLRAGQKARTFVEHCHDDSHLLMLISGGASSLVEHLKKGQDLSGLTALTEAGLAEGVDIVEINARRTRISAVKGGQLLRAFGGSRVTTLAISDVCGDGIDVIASGLGAPPIEYDFDYDSHIIASNAIARAAVSAKAVEMGLNVIVNHEAMYADVADVADRIVQDVRAGPAGLYIFGGEPTVVLPKNPGRGGRNQALALELARRLYGGANISGLVAGTDGSDGPTDAAGGFFDGKSYEAAPNADFALQNANSAAFLAGTGNQFITGPTGTNVMDLALILKDN